MDYFALYQSIWTKVAQGHLTHSQKKQIPALILQGIINYADNEKLKTSHDVIRMGDLLEDLTKEQELYKNS